MSPPPVTPRAEAPGLVRPGAGAGAAPGLAVHHPTQTFMVGPTTSPHERVTRRRYDSPGNAGFPPAGPDESEDPCFHAGKMPAFPGRPCRPYTFTATGGPRHVQHRHRRAPCANPDRERARGAPRHRPGGGLGGRREGHLSPAGPRLPPRLRPVDARAGQGLLRRGRARGRVQDGQGRGGRRQAGRGRQRGHRGRHRRHPAHRARQRDPGEGGGGPRWRLAHDPRHRPGGRHRPDRGPQGDGR